MRIVLYLSVIFSLSLYTKGYTQAYNEPTPDSVIFDTYNMHQNTHMAYGKMPFDYQGSGDTNNDGVHDAADEVIPAEYNYRFDVDADGDNDSDDSVIIKSGKIPARDINKLTIEEQREYIQNTYDNIDNTKGEKSGWICNDYTNNAISNYTGVNNHEEWVQTPAGSKVLDADMNGLFNLKCCKGKIKLRNGIEHVLPIFFTSEKDTNNLEKNSITNFEKYFILDGGTGIPAEDWMRTNEGDYFDVSWYGFFKGKYNNIFGLKEIIKYYYNKNEDPIISYINANIPRVDPDNITINVNHLEDTIINYTKNIDLKNEKYAKFSVKTNLDTVSEFKVDGFYAVNGKNFLETEYEMILKDSINEFEKDYILQGNLKLIQRTTDSIGNTGLKGDVDIELKNISATRGIKVRDIENPEIGVRDSEEVVNFSRDNNFSKDFVILEARDNTKVVETGLENIVSTRTDEGMGHINYEITGDAYAIDFVGRKTIEPYKILVDDLENPVIKNKIFNEPFNYTNSLIFNKTQVIDTATDNSLIVETGLENISSTQGTEGISKVNYDITGDSYAIDLRENKTTTPYKIEVRDLESPSNLEIPKDIVISEKDLEEGELNRNITGIASANDNSNLPLDIKYDYQKTNEDDANIYYDIVITFTDIAGNDTNGIQKVIIEKGVGVNESNMCVNIFPNPTNNLIHVSHTLHETINIEIKDILGKTLYKVVEYTQDIDIDLSEYNSGVFFIVLSTSNQQWIERIIKN